MDKKKKTEKQEEQINPTVIMGNMAFQLSDILDEKPEAKEKIEAWLDKKAKAFDKAEKRKRIYRKK